MSEENQGFLSRWSKRKQAIAAGEEVQESHPDHPVIETPDADEEAARLAILEENRQAAEAIDIAALTSESDFTPFMQEGVPHLLKQRAMRVLFRSNPVFANLDGLCDYDDNFADPSLILKTFDSAYKIGRGYLTDDDEDLVEDDETLVADATDETDEAEEVVASNEEDDTLEDDDALAAAVTGEEPLEPQPAIAYATAEEESEVPPMPRVSLRDRLQLDA